jgi:hypothetical protein
MSDLIYDISRYEYNDGNKVSIDFRLNVPKEVSEDLKSSATVKKGLVDNFELRLGLLSKERYDPNDIRETMNNILTEMDLSRTRYREMREEIEAESEIDNPDFPDADPEDEIKPKLGYDPHWGELGFYQVHLNCQSFFPPIMDEDEFKEFVHEFTTTFIDRFEWDEVKDE